tara:strand:+ start:3823 stop:4128 length:306 start_codon:yes stop_codon:yes gene_type:complete
MAGAGFKTFVANEELTAADVNTYLMEQSVMVFNATSNPTKTAEENRTAALPSPSHGMITYRTDVDLLEIRDGSSWVRMGTKTEIDASASDDALLTLHMEVL